MIEGGCSDDGFADFRAGLIGLGRKAYEDALRDPNTLARQPKNVDFSIEEMNYVGASAYESVVGEELPEIEMAHPSEPIGEQFDEETVDEKFPKLAAKFGDR